MGIRSYLSIASDYMYYSKPDLSSVSQNDK